jgi:hypothetical protein
MRRRRRQKGADFLETDREKKRINNKGVMRDALVGVRTVGDFR